MKNAHKSKKSPVKKAFATSFIVSLALFSALVALNLDVISCYFGINPCVTDSPFKNPAQGKWNNGGIADHPAKTQPFEQYINNTVFIGDSRTNGLKSFHLVSPRNVYAIDGASHQSARTERFINFGTGSSLTIAQAVSIVRPERMIVSFGINGVAFMGEQVFFEQYDAFIDELKAASPQSLIIIQSILPVSHSRQVQDPRMSNNIIDWYNSKLRELAGQKGCRFWDTSGLLKNPLNCLSSEYDSGDGLHFSARAYEVLLENLDQNRFF